MGTISSEKLHVVLVPFPAQGHVRPIMQLAKLLHYSQGFHITFVNTEFNHRRLIRSNGPDAVKGLPDFRFETIPDGLPHSDQDATQDVPALCDSVRRNCLAPFRELLAKLNALPDVPNVSCIIADGLMSFAIEAAKEIGVPEVQFWTASACSFMGYLHFGELVRRGIIPFKDKEFMHDGTLETSIEWIPGMRNIRLKDIPSFIRTTDIEDIMFNFLDGEAQNCLTSSAIIFNTFNVFEKQVLDAIATKFPSIYNIGPLPLMLSYQVQEESHPSNSINSSLWKEDTTCLEWLDKRELNSVVYVNYGSVTTMSEDHLKEFAWGLANSKHPFIWIVRADIVKGDSATTLPPEFMGEIKGRGLIVSWCPQFRVLRHPSIGAFLTHCGWNSMMETICAGVPVICWPFFADQHTNCRYAAVEWGTGLEVDHDVKRDQVEGLIRMMLEGEEGKRMKERALYWKKKAEEATSIGGSSYCDFERFLKDYLAKVC